MSEERNISLLPQAFILGKGRSGTTLLQMMLHAHPHVTAPLEARFILALRTRYENVTDWNRELCARFVKDLKVDTHLFQFWKLDYDALQQRLEAISPTLSFARACQQVMLHFAPQKHAQTRQLVYKSPIHSLFAEEIADVFPQARFIHMVREPRANVHSHRQAFGTKKANIIAHKWVHDNEQVLAFLKKRRAPSHILRYEDLVQNPEAEMRRLCHFLSIDFHADMLMHHQKLASLRDHNQEYFAKDIHASVNKAVTANKNLQWQTGLSADEAKQVERITSKLASQFGYNFPDHKDMKMPAGEDIILRRARLLRHFYHSPMPIKRLLIMLNRARPK